jgi:hypothetical protein
VSVGGGWRNRLRLLTVSVRALVVCKRLLVLDACHGCCLRLLVAALRYTTIIRGTFKSTNAQPQNQQKLFVL